MKYLINLFATLLTVDSVISQLSILIIEYLTNLNLSRSYHHNQSLLYVNGLSYQLGSVSIIQYADDSILFISHVNDLLDSYMSFRKGLGDSEELYGIVLRCIILYELLVVLAYLFFGI